MNIAGWLCFIASPLILLLTFPLTGQEVFRVLGLLTCLALVALWRTLLACDDKEAE